MKTTKNYFPLLAVKLAVLVLLAETAIMGVLPFLGIRSALLENTADAVLLVLVVTPFLVRWALQAARMVGEEVEASRRQLLDIIEFLPDATFVIDSGKKVIAWNRALEKMTGVSKKEMVGKGDYAYAVPFHGERRPIIIDLVSGQDTETEKRYKYVKRTADGTLYAEIFVPSLYGGKGAYVWGTASPLRDGAGNLYGAIESVRDITERKRAEEKILESEDKFRNLTEKSMVGVYLVQDGVFKYCNPALAGIFGFELDEIFGKKGPKDVVLPEDWPIVMENLRKRSDGEVESLNYGFRGLKKNGEVIDVEVYGSRTFYDGKPAVIGTLLDITGRKRMEEALRDAEERSRLILKSAGDGIIGVDTDGLILFANESAQDMLGWKFEEMRGKRLHPLMHHTRPDGSPYPVQECPMYEAFTLSKESQVDNEILWRKDGSSFFVIYSARPMIRNGRTEGAVITFKDITERKKIELEIRTLNAELEVRVEQRTAELRSAQERLIQSEKMSAVGQLAAGVAHEINNPLGIILGFAQGLVKRLKENDPAGMPLRSIERETLRCKDLVQELLIFSRSSKIEEEDLDINEALGGALSLIFARARTQGVEIVRELSQGLPTIPANKGKIQQTLINLANNSLDAMPAGGTLTIRTALSLKRPGHVEIRVQDTGHGIPKEIQPRVLEPFFTTKEVGKGTGLGLAVVYEIVKKHNGSLEMESAEGKGTLFSIFLPIKAAKAPSDRQPTP